MSKDGREEMYFVFNRLICTLFDSETANRLMASLINAKRPFPEICIEILIRARRMAEQLVENLSEINNHNLTSWILHNSLEGEIKGDSNRAKFSKEQKDKLIELILTGGTEAQKFRSARFLLFSAKALDFGQQNQLYDVFEGLVEQYMPPYEMVNAYRFWPELHPILRAKLQKIIVALKQSGILDASLKAEKKNPRN